ncbi:hypothetical protein F5Y10DRAFT_176823 [Nemania abortiva]|nr:hypothetical protein F5Y10DRAFT_176823 [Nemania abortiva]
MLAVSLQKQNTHSSLQAAKNLFQKIIEEKQDGFYYKDLVSRSASWLGSCLFREGNYQEAKPYFEQAIDSPLKWFSPIYYKGMALYRLEMYSDAASWFCSALETEMCPANSGEAIDCLYWAGRSHAATGNWPEAIDKFHLALSSSKARRGWQYALACKFHYGRALFAGQKYTEAKRQFELLLEKPGKLLGRPLGSDYYLGCCLLRLRQLAAAEKVFLDSRVLSLRFQEAHLKTRNATDELAIMSARYQLLRCSTLQGKLLDGGMLDNVLTFFSNWCSITKNYENSDPAIALVEYHLAVMAMGHRRLERAVVFFELALANYEIKSKQQADSGSTLPLLECQSELGLTLHKLGRHGEALAPLCKVLEGLKIPMPATQGLSASASQQKFNHQIRLMRAKLSLCEASHCATYTPEAEQLAKDVLAWVRRQQQRNQEEEEEEGNRVKGEQKQQQSGENSPKELTDEQKQTPEQETLLQSQAIQEQTPGIQTQQHMYACPRGASCYRRANTQMCALNALVLLAQITHDIGEDYSRAVSLCNDALAIIPPLKADLPLHNFIEDEIRLHAYLALSLAKLPERRDEAEEQARKAIQLEKAKCTTTGEATEESTEKMSYCQAIGGFMEEFGATVGSVNE